MRKVNDLHTVKWVHVILDNLRAVIEVIQGHSLTQRHDPFGLTVRTGRGQKAPGKTRLDHVAGHLRGFRSLSDRLDIDENHLRAVLRCGRHFEGCNGLDGQAIAEVRPLVELLGIAELERASSAADAAAGAVFGEVHFAMEDRGGEGAAFDGALTFLDAVDDDFRLELHDL